jgi:VanZ family protein
MREYRMKSFGIYWLPVLIWMGVIFSASGDAFSAGHTSRIIGPLLQWLFPTISAGQIAAVQLAVRKASHMLEYAVLSWLVWRALARPQRHQPQPWSWRLAGIVLAVCLIYATSDEFHQCFVPSRMGSVLDVLWDGCGATLGLISLWVIGRSPVLRWL